MKKKFLLFIIFFSIIKEGHCQTTSIQEDESLAYNADNFVSRSAKTQSNGDIVTTNNVYVNDILSLSCSTFTGEGIGLSNLKSLNIISKPVETYVSVTKPTGPVFVVSAELYTFYNTQPYPSAYYKSETQVPLSLFTPYHVVGCEPVKDPTYILQETYNHYDLLGNLLEKTIKGGKNISYIYSYKGMYKVATVENASNDQIAYSSFETQDHGFWNYDELSTAYISSHVPQIAGPKAFLFSRSSGVITATVSINNYIVSFWSNDLTIEAVGYNGSTFVPGTLVLGPTINGWTYHEWEFNAINSVVISATSGLVDEVRLYPANAQMETAAYLPLVGMLYSCDVANHLSYYTYDDLNRLIYIQDQNAQIIKKLEYGIQQPE